MDTLHAIHHKEHIHMSFLFFPIASVEIASGIHRCCLVVFIDVRLSRSRDKLYTCSLVVNSIHRCSSPVNRSLTDCLFSLSFLALAGNQCD